MDKLHHNYKFKGYWQIRLLDTGSGARTVYEGNFHFPFLELFICCPLVTHQKQRMSICRTFNFDIQDEFTFHHSFLTLAEEIRVLFWHNYACHLEIFLIRPFAPHCTKSFAQILMRKKRFLKIAKFYFLHPHWLVLFGALRLF